MQSQLTLRHPVSQRSLAHLDLCSAKILVESPRVSSPSYLFSIIGVFTAKEGKYGINSPQTCRYVWLLSVVGTDGQAVAREIPHRERVFVIAQTTQSPVTHEEVSMVNWGM